MFGSKCSHFRWNIRKRYSVETLSIISGPNIKVTSHKISKAIGLQRKNMPYKYAKDDPYTKTEKSGS